MQHLGDVKPLSHIVFILLDCVGIHNMVHVKQCRCVYTPAGRRPNQPLWAEGDHREGVFPGDS